MASIALKGAVIALGFFVFGILLSPHIPVLATGMAIAPQTHIPFESVELYQNELRIKQPNLQYARVTSGSMMPVIPRGATIVEKVPSGPHQIQIGDIISFYEPTNKQVVVHEVISIEQNGMVTFYKTKGTANPKEDPWLVPYSNVKGILVAVLR